MFKNPKFIKINELYNKIIKDFKVNKVYITDIFHPRKVYMEHCTPSDSNDITEWRNLETPIKIKGVWQLV